MKTFLRLAALGVFIAAGVALAVHVGTSVPAGPVAAESLAPPSSVPGDKTANGMTEERGETGRTEPSQPSGAAAPSDASPTESPHQVGDSPDTTSAGRPADPEAGPAPTGRFEPGDRPVAQRPAPGAPTAGVFAGPSGAPGVAAGNALPGQAPVPVEPHPALAQRVTPSASETLAVRLAQMLDRELERSASGSRSAAPPTVAGEDAAAPADAAGASGASPASPASKSETEAKVVGEGDGRLSIHAADEDIRKILELLGAQGNLNILASKSVQGNVSATLSGVDVQSALEAILKSTGYVARRDGQFIFIGTPEEFDTLEQSLDRVGTRIYRPNYVSAAELKNLVEPLLTPDVGVASVSAPSEVGIESDDATAGGDAYAGGDVVLVRDYESVLAQIDRTVAEIDVRPMQVHIEAMILSVLLDDKNSLGVNFAAFGENTRIGWGTIPDPAAAAGMLGSIKFDGNGLKFGFFDGDVATFINALETVGDTNVIATPRLMALNKQRAEIHIGEELGYVSTTVSETSTTQSVDFLSTGTVLRIRPFISSDGLIRMEVHPELSTGTVDVEGGFTLPNKETTQVTSNIMVRDGCTVVIGGLMRDETKVTSSQIPLLGSLPMIGPLFRSTSEELGRREIIVLITPRIVYEPDTCREGDKVACEFHRRHAVAKEKMSPLGKRAISRRYYRLAQVAWAHGDRARALRFAEMAVHFDSLNRAAIDLRSDIWLGRQHGDHTLSGALAAGSAADAADAPPGVLDSEALPPWLLEDLEHGAQPVAPPPVHPLDRGRPGTSTEVNRPRRLQ